MERCLRPTRRAEPGMDPRCGSFRCCCILTGHHSRRYYISSLQPSLPLLLHDHMFDQMPVRRKKSLLGDDSMSVAARATAASGHNELRNNLSEEQSSGPGRDAMAEKVGVAMRCGVSAPVRRRFV